MTEKEMKYMLKDIIDCLEDPDIREMLYLDDDIMLEARDGQEAGYLTNDQTLEITINNQRFLLTIQEVRR